MKDLEIILGLTLDEAEEAITSIEDLGLYRLDDEFKEESLYNEHGLLPKEVDLLDKLTAAVQSYHNTKE